jgi:hypothetical protein
MVGFAEAIFPDEEELRVIVEAIVPGPQTVADLQRISMIPYEDMLRILAFLMKLGVVRLHSGI